MFIWCINKGKTALITGASKGSGQAIAIRLAEEGADIIAHYNSGDIAQTQAAVLEKKVLFHALCADLSNSSDVVRLAHEAIEISNIDILVNNAGNCEFIDFLDLTEQS